MPLPAITTAPTGNPFAVSQNNSTIYLFDYFNFFGLKGRYDREAVEKWKGEAVFNTNNGYEK
jgi:hypothetical protein